MRPLSNTKALATGIWLVFFFQTVLRGVDVSGAFNLSG
jgi:hypothetical protein